MIHLPVAVADLTEALSLARRLARSLAPTPQVDVGGTTVSAEDAQHVRHWVLCDRIMPERRRCGRRADHDGGCLPVDEP
ncbi:hypothetical protein O7634_18195 [Micromonospora sp. WMMD1120]|uniref:hypothetical protein n=1 Tax=Micromonospora sp. WMMD1120 TaxID=3016106 RepID=UPI00241727BA|nr:hypothetical protein [Micromonospora sp. WMMD1120]MDG4808681.1 hypothetical protein [Micromonospora sp. WMMD1120]